MSTKKLILPGGGKIDTSQAHSEHQAETIEESFDYNSAAQEPPEEKFRRILTDCLQRLRDLTALSMTEHAKEMNQRHASLVQSVNAGLNDLSNRIDALHDTQSSADQALDSLIKILLCNPSPEAMEKHRKILNGFLIADDEEKKSTRSDDHMTPEEKEDLDDFIESESNYLLDTIDGIVQQCELPAFMHAIVRQKLGYYKLLGNLKE